MDQAFIPAITALVVALAGLFTSIATLYKVIQHEPVLLQTQRAVNGQAAALERIADKNSASQVRLEASVATLNEADAPHGVYIVGSDGTGGITPLGHT